jgi:hypothetical protein
MMKGRNPRGRRIALALAGSGPSGAIYEIGELGRVIHCDPARAA